MKVFFMQDSLFGEDGILKQENKYGIPFLKTPHYGYMDNNDVLIFAYGNMYTTRVPKRKMEKFRASLQGDEKSVYWFLKDFPHIRLTEIKKVLQRPTYHIAGGISINENTLDFCRALHVDTVAKVKISSLWMLNKEVAELLAPHVTKPGVRTDVDVINDYLVPKKRIGMFSYTIRRLSLGYDDFFWDEENCAWVEYDNYDFD